MADLVEDGNWVNGVYQIETTDPVVGGPPNLQTKAGLSNIQGQQLGNRTAWLRAQVLQLLTDVAALEAAIDGNDFATQADIDAAINGLVDGAPAALNTLQELASELADQDNAVAALTSGLSAKLNQSAFTAAAVLTLIKTVDGPGSGLDADLLDGVSSASFVRTTRTLTAGTGLTGGGALSANRSISVNFAETSDADAGTNTTEVMNPFLTARMIGNAQADEIYSGSNGKNTNYPVGTYVTAFVGNSGHLNHNVSQTLKHNSDGSIRFNGNEATLSGVWRTRGGVNGAIALCQRVS